MKKKLLLFHTAILIFFNPISLMAQDDCCGMGTIFSSILGSGIFGGYGFQQYSAAGLDGYITQNLESEGISYDDFGFSHGWRAGANIVGIRQNNLLAVFKIYYQSMKEKQQQDGTYQGNPATQKLEVELNSWGLGFGLSYILSNHFDYRILDALMTFNNADFTNSISSTTQSQKFEYESASTNLGFTFDTGFVFYPLPPYIAIEVIGGYSFLTIETVEEKDSFAELTTTDDFIDGGGFFAAAVLTIGIPFN